jgi:hypothetical protein
MRETRFSLLRWGNVRRRVVGEGAIEVETEIGDHRFTIATRARGAGDEPCRREYIGGHRSSTLRPRAGRLLVVVRLGEPDSAMTALANLTFRLTAALRLGAPPIAISFRGAPGEEAPFGGDRPAPNAAGHSSSVPAGCVFWDEGD